MEKYHGYKINYPTVNLRITIIHKWNQELLQFECNTSSSSSKAVACIHYFRSTKSIVSISITIYRIHYRLLKSTVVSRKQSHRSTGCRSRDPKYLRAPQPPRVSIVNTTPANRLWLVTIKERLQPRDKGGAVLEGREQMSENFYDRK